MPPTTIFKRGEFYNQYDEHRASVALKPGYLCELDVDGKIKPHTVRGGQCPRRFAIEDCLQGETVGSTRTGLPTDTYQIGDLVRDVVAKQGDRAHFWLQKGENVARGDYLISFGDGTLCKAASALLANNAADSTTITNTVAETTASNGTATIKKNTLKVGDVIRIRALWVTPSTNATDTLTLRLKIGSTVILATAAVDVANGDIGLLTATLTVRTIGATGTIIGSGQWSLGVPGTATVRSEALASTVLDTTADAAVTTSAQWSVANAGNQAILREFSVEHVKAGLSAANGVAGGEIVAQAEEAKDLSIAVDHDFILCSVV